MPNPQDFPPPHADLIDAWAKVRKALNAFALTADAVQSSCPHSQAVQYNPTYFTFKRPDCQDYPRRVCVNCGLVVKAAVQLDPSTFDEDGPMGQAEILAVYKAGYRANHFTLPYSPVTNRLDGAPPPAGDDEVSS